mgnify:CR=1 FL=1
MKIQISDIMQASISELEDYDMEMASDFEKSDWRVKATRALSHMKRTKALVRTRLDKLYYGEERLLHGAILAEIKKTMSIGKFMECVQRAKRNAGVI